MKLIAGSLAVAALMLCAANAPAETTVQLSDVHLCCGACVRIVGATLSEIEVKHECNADAGTISIKGASDDVVKQALAALGEAGFYGTSNNPDLAIPAGEVPEGTVQRLVVKNAHNCCGACAVAIKGACESVDGVQACTVKAKEPQFVVEGNFSAEALLKALNDAGFQVQLSQ